MRVQDAKENNYTALFEEHEYHGFVQGLLAAMEYEAFYRLMLVTAKKKRSGDTNSERAARFPRDDRCPSADGVGNGGLDTGSVNGRGSYVSGRRPFGETDGEDDEQPSVRK